MTKTRILHIEDCLEIGQIRFDLWAFQRGQGSSAQAEAYVDVHEARLLFTDLARGVLPERFQALGGRRRDGEVVARVLTIEEVKANNPIKTTIEHGLGEPLPSGLIKPGWWQKGGKGKAEIEISILLDHRTVRKIALAVLSHLQAWAAASYYARLTAETWQPDDDGQHVDSDTGEVVG